MRVAIYSSVLYGEDFIEESIKSISDHVDKVFVVVMERPWGLAHGITYKGQWISWPAVFDNSESKVTGLSKVTVVKGYKYTPWCRHGYGAMMVLGKLKCRTDEILFIDPDCVFSKQEADKFFAEWDSSTCGWAVPRSIELWKTSAHQIKRDRPLISMHRDLTALPGMVHAPIQRLNASVFNLGLCVSDKTMLWKHLTAMAFSDITGEAIPNPEWYEKVWLKWDAINNNANLEVSLGGESAIPSAAPYEEGVTIPQEIVNRINEVRKL